MHSARSRARVAGIPCDLDTEALRARFMAGVCEVTGIPFDLGRPADRGEMVYRSPFAPSVDRIDPDPAVGYVTSNVQFVCSAYNSAKGQGTHADVLRLANAVMERHAQQQGVA